ncbi:MAG: DUF3326 domain-containing protein [Synechocystis sp.]|nr:DUF3326 domain-containing protein [Synechocystis sp.]
MSYDVVLIVPTGVGAAIGGYAGDALPIARSISQVCDRLITHPNVLNGAQLYYPIANALYVEGYALDRFAKGDWGLTPVTQNAIGLILDQGIEPDLRTRHLQVADGARATLGLTLTDYVITDEPLGVELRLAASGSSWGTIANPGSLLRAADKLRSQTNAQAIAVVARFPDDVGPELLHNYRHGAGVDPLSGAEAVISHLIVRQFQIPCAHAPALSPLPLDAGISPRSAAEELGYTFLPCVLMGLSRAPQYQTFSPQAPATLWGKDIDAVIVPASACGGSAVMSLSHTQTRIIAVENNTTQLNVPPESLGISVLKVNSYLEAIGVLCADRAGINLECFTPNFSSLHCLP